MLVKFWISEIEKTRTWNHHTLFSFEQPVWKIYIRMIAKLLIRQGAASTCSPSKQLKLCLNVQEIFVAKMASITPCNDQMKQDFYVLVNENL